jgi:hypothetical protein
MDSHIQGPRGVGAIGATLSHIIASAVFGDGDGTKKICQTDGASAENPLFVRISGQIVTAFDGTVAVFTLQQTDTDGANPTTLAQISSFSAGKFDLYFFLTADKIFNLIYAADSGEADGTFADGVFNSTTTVTSATAAFTTARDAGKSITGVGIPDGTTIASVTNGTTIVLSQATTTTGTGKTFTIADREPVDPGTAGEGHYSIVIAGRGQMEELVFS